MLDVNKILKVAFDEVGYLEKKSANSNLYDKLADAGSNNFTKYWKELAPSMNGSAWCNCFVNWCFIQAYGPTIAKQLLCTDSQWSYYTPTSSSYFKKKNQWYTSGPQIGDVIYFKNSTRICHVGLVYAVDSSYVYTVEGNTSSASGVVANGGGVAKKKYSLKYVNIAGYGRPNYSQQAIKPTVINSYSLTDFVKECQVAMKFVGKNVDGIAGKMTLTNTVTLSTKFNKKHALVRPVQKRLNALGYNCGNADGDFGSKTDSAVKEFQSKFMKQPDGEITKNGLTWKKLLGMVN